MKNIFINVILLIVFTSNVSASKVAECAAVFYLGSELLRETGQIKEAENNKKISKILGSVLVENHGQKRAEILITNEINKIKENTTEDTVVQAIVNKAISCTRVFKK